MSAERAIARFDALVEDGLLPERAMDAVTKDLDERELMALWDHYAVNMAADQAGAQMQAMHGIGTFPPPAGHFEHDA